MGREQLVSLFIMIAAFVFVYFFQVNVVIVILACGLIGLFTTIWVKKKG
jgi:chromate transport protein ChrA